MNAGQVIGLSYGRPAAHQFPITQGLRALGPIIPKWGDRIVVVPKCKTCNGEVNWIPERIQPPLIRLWCDEYAIAMDMGLQWALSDARDEYGPLRALVNEWIVHKGV